MKLEIRRRGVTVTDEIWSYLKDRLRNALGRFRRRIPLVRVYLRDSNAPRGGLGNKCRVVVELPPRGRVVVTEVDGDIRAAIYQAAARVGFALKRHLKRRQARRRLRRHSRRGMAYFAS